MLYDCHFKKAKLSETLVLTEVSIVDRLWLSIKDRQIGGSYMAEYKLGIVESHFADIVSSDCSF